MKQYTREERLRVLSGEEDPVTREFLRAVMDCSFDIQYLRLFNRDQVFLQKLLLFIAVADHFPVSVISEMFRGKDLPAIQEFREKKLAEKYGTEESREEEKSDNRKETSGSLPEEGLQKVLKQIQEAMQIFQQQIDTWNEQFVEPEYLSSELQAVKRERDELAEQIESLKKEMQTETPREEKEYFGVAVWEKLNKRRKEKAGRRTEKQRRDCYVSILADLRIQPFAVDILDAAFQEGFSVEEMRSLPLLSEPEIVQGAFDNIRYRKMRLHQLELADNRRNLTKGI